MINLETQEAGTGKWFPIIIYTPGTEQQMVDAKQAAEALRGGFGLITRVMLTEEGTR